MLYWSKANATAAKLFASEVAWKEDNKTVNVYEVYVRHESVYCHTNFFPPRIIDKFCLILTQLSIAVKHSA